MQKMLTAFLQIRPGFWEEFAKCTVCSDHPKAGQAGRRDVGDEWAGWAISHPNLAF